MDNVKKLHRPPRLVRLQVPDQVPLRRIAADLLDLPLGLLHLVLAKNSLSGGDSLTDGLGRMRLAYRDQLYLARSRPTRAAAAAIRNCTSAKFCRE